jgi:hypothetical protein
MASVAQDRITPPDFQTPGALLHFAFNAMRPMTFSFWLAALALAGGAGLAQTAREPVALQDLVQRGDPLAAHDLWFDARFAQSAVDYLRIGDPGILDRLPNCPPPPTC